MHYNTKDITGQKFGLLTALKYIETRNSHAYWECQCECGKTIVADGSNLRRGNVKSCGCSSEVDLKDKKFGRLLAIEKTNEKDKNNGYYWKCLCDCGNEILVPSHSLKTGNTQSCGCLHKEKFVKPGNRLVDIIGQRFGRLVVVAKAERPLGVNNNAQYWLCKCDCGNEKVISGKGLRKKDGTKSCGCLVEDTRMMFEDLTGKIFGRLEVIKLSKRIGKRNTRYWECKCDCGNIKTVSGGALRSGQTQSCGCYRYEMIKKNNRIEESEAAFNSVYSSYRASARNRNLDFLIDKDMFRKYTSDNCFYCGLEPKQEQKSNNGSYIHNGIDRINNDNGYVDGNIVTCCKTCNYAKHIMPQNEFFEWVRRVNNNLELKGIFNNSVSI